MDTEKQHKAQNPVTGYFTTAASELRKVTWPSRDEVWQKTRVVIVFSLIFAVFLGSVDYLLNAIVQFFLQ